MSGSGHSSASEALDFAANRGAAATLQKPFTCAALAEAIDRSFARQMVA
jgi:hypothetical protein